MSSCQFVNVVTAISEVNEKQHGESNKFPNFNESLLTDVDNPLFDFNKLENVIIRMDLQRCDIKYLVFDSNEVLETFAFGTIVSSTVSTKKWKLIGFAND